MRIAPWFSVVIERIAAAAASGEATRFLIAWPRMPVPSAFDSTSTWPGRAVRFDHSLPGSTSPVTDSPNLTSGSRTE